MVAVAVAVVEAAIEVEIWTSFLLQARGVAVLFLLLCSQN